MWRVTTWQVFDLLSVELQFAHWIHLLACFFLCLFLGGVLSFYHTCSSVPIFSSANDSISLLCKEKGHRVFPKSIQRIEQKNHPNTHHATEDLQDVSSLNGPNIDGILAASGLSWIREIGTRKNRRWIIAGWTVWMSRWVEILPKMLGWKPLNIFETIEFLWFQTWNIL